jgi:pSer/pThr/pTyr-binding forkhead associated (FHA) protein
MFHFIWSVQEIHREDIMNQTPNKPEAETLGRLGDRMDSAPQATLRVEYGPELGRVIHFDGSAPLLIGRHSHCDVRVSDTDVSRRHATLSLDLGDWCLDDLQSQNGTFVNGVRIARWQQLNDNDQIRVGTTLMRISLPVAVDQKKATTLRPSNVKATPRKRKGITRKPDRVPVPVDAQAQASQQEDELLHALLTALDAN